MGLPAGSCRGGDSSMRVSLGVSGNYYSTADETGHAI